MKFEFDTFDPQELFSKVQGFCVKKKVKEIELHFFCLEVDDEISKNVKVEELGGELLELWKKDEGHFYFEVTDARFDFDGGTFRIMSEDKLIHKMFHETAFV